MTKKKYLNKVLRGIKCSRKTKKDIQKQLETDIDERLNEGESLENILEQMGTYKEVSESFNENMSDAEKKAHKRNVTLGILGFIIGFIIIVAFAVNAMIPKTLDIEDSVYFDETQVEEQVVECIELFETADTQELQILSTDNMQSYFTQETITDTKSQLSDDWGTQNSIGTIYMSELVQAKQHYAVTEVTVAYENITVTYRLTFDIEMKLAGIYIR